MSEWTQQRRDDYADGYEFARQELLANGERVEKLTEELREHENDGTCKGLLAAVRDVLSVYPKEAENG